MDLEPARGDDRVSSGAEIVSMHESAHTRLAFLLPMMVDDLRPESSQQLCFVAHLTRFGAEFLAILHLRSHVVLGLGQRTRHALPRSVASAASRRARNHLL